MKKKSLDDVCERLGSLPLLAFFYPAVDIAVKARLNEIHDVLFVDVFVRFSFLRPLFDEGSVQLVCDLLWPARGDAALEYAHTVELEVVFYEEHKVEDRLRDLILFFNGEVGHFAKVRGGEQVFADLVQKGIDVLVMRVKGGAADFRRRTDVRDRDFLDGFLFKSV